MSGSFFIRKLSAHRSNFTDYPFIFTEYRKSLTRFIIKSIVNSSGGAGMKFTLNIDRNCTEEVIANVHERTPLIDEIERMVTQEGTVNQIAGILGDEIKLLTVDEIECFYVEDEKTYASFRDGKKYCIRKRLYEIESTLPSDFIRINKSAIANTKRISRFKVQLSGAVDAQFESGYLEAVSRRCFVELRKRYGL
jgi:DNA-binding LytR/AlgR family response regulator